MSFGVAENRGSARTARIRLSEDHDARCEIQQAGETVDASHRIVTWASQLEVPGGSGQVVINGARSLFQGEGRSMDAGEAGSGAGRIEAVLLAAKGPGTWRFELGGAFEPGTLRVLAGRDVQVSADSVVFRLRGAAGERVVFTFRTR